MHELPATRGMLQVALEAAEGVAAERVLAIDVVVGRLTSIVDDSVQFYFDIIAEGTAAEGAELRFRRESAVLTCGECGRNEEVEAPLPPVCPGCGSLRIRVQGGQQFYVESIETEDVPAGAKGGAP